MANYTMTISSSSEYEPGFGTISFSSFSPNRTLQVGDTLTISYTRYAGGATSVSVEGWESGKWNNTSNATLTSGQSVTRTATAGAVDVLTAVFSGSNFSNRTSTATIEAAAPVIVADTDITFSTATTASATTSVSITGSGGSGGTRYYNKSNTGSTPQGYWTTTNSFSSTRGSGYYFWTRIGTGTAYYSEYYVVPYLNPDTVIASINDVVIGASSTSFTIPIASGGANDVYQVRNRAGTETHESITGNGTITVTDAPSVGSSKDYSIYVKKPTAAGGNDSYVDVGSEGDFTVYRGAAPSGGTTVEVTGYGTNITKNIFNDDVIRLEYSVRAEDRDDPWAINNKTAVSASPTAGYFSSGTPTGAVYVSTLTGFSASSYSLDFNVDNVKRFTLSGTVTDPYIVTNISYGSSTGNNPGNGTTTVQSAAQTFTTARAGETLDFNVTGGEFYNGSEWATSGTVTDGASTHLRAIVPSGYSSSQVATVTFSKNSVDKRSESYTVSTRAQDVSPDSFDLGGPANFHNRNTYIYPPLVTVSGIDSDADIAVSVSGTTGAFAYSKNGGAYTTDADTVTLDDTVQARIRTSSDYNTQRSLTLNIGNQSDTYYATTEIYYSLGANVSNAEKSAVTYRNFVVASSAYGSAYVTFTASGTADTKVSTDNATWVNSVTRKNGQVVYVKATASSSYASTTTATVTGGGIAPSFSITTRAQDATPDAFTLGSSSGVNRGSYGYSSEITIAGMDSDASVTASLSGDSGKLFRYKTSSTGAWSAWGTSNVTGVTNGYVFQVALTASTSFSTDKTCSLDVGGTSSTFTVTSEASVSPDTTLVYTPNTPAFVDTFFTLTTTGAGSTTDYTVRTSSYTGTSVGSFSGNADNTVINHTPSTSGTTYYVTGLVTDANDGTGTAENAGTFTVTRGEALLPDSSITASWPSAPLEVTDTSFSVGITNGSSHTTYEVKTDSYTGTVVGSIAGNGSLVVNNFPEIGESKTYYLTARRPSSEGGNNSLVNIENITLSKDDTELPPDPVGEDYGLVVYSEDGTTEIINPGRRIVNLAYYSVISVAAGQTVTITVADAGDPTKTVVSFSTRLPNLFDVTTSGDSINITNNSSFTFNSTLIVLRVS